MFLGRQGRGWEQQKGVSLLDQNMAVFWLLGRSMKYLTETVQLRRCAGVNKTRKDIRLRSIENEGFGLE